MDERTDAVSSSDDLHEIRRDIERTQREMSRTIDEIQHRLSPHYIMERTKNSVREAGVKNSRKFMDKVRDNPIPAAMVGLGLFLLMRDSDRDDAAEFDYRGDRGWQSGRDWSTPSSAAEYRDVEFQGGHAGLDHARGVIGGAAHSVKERASEAVDTAREKLGSAREASSEALHSAAERAQHLRSLARYQARHAASGTKDFLRDTPLVAGLAALAVGALCAAAIPETEIENRAFGEARDRVADRAKEVAREGVDKAKDVAGKAASAATEAVKTETKSSAKTDRAENVGLGVSRT